MTEMFQWPICLSKNDWNVSEKKSTGTSISYTGSQHVNYVLSTY